MVGCLQGKDIKVEQPHETVVLSSRHLGCTIGSSAREEEVVLYFVRWYYFVLFFHYIFQYIFISSDYKSSL